MKSVRCTDFPILADDIAEYIREFTAHVKVCSHCTSNARSLSNEDFIKFIATPHSVETTVKIFSAYALRCVRNTLERHIDDDLSRAMKAYAVHITTPHYLPIRKKHTLVSESSLPAPL